MTQDEPLIETLPRCETILLAEYVFAVSHLVFPDS